MICAVVQPLPTFSCPGATLSSLSCFSLSFSLEFSVSQIKDILSPLDANLLFEHENLLECTFRMYSLYVHSQIYFVLVT